MLEAAKSLKDAGAKIDRIVAVIDREEGARQNIEIGGIYFSKLCLQRLIWGVTEMSESG